MSKSKPAKLCSAGVKLRNQINKAFPNRDKASDGWIGDARHKKTKSDHNPDENSIVRALDIDSNLSKDFDAKDLAEALRLAAKNGDKRISYIIYKKKIASKILNWKWRPYVGSNPHTSHIHISFTKDGDKVGPAFDLSFTKNIEIKNRVSDTVKAKKMLANLIEEKAKIEIRIAELKKTYKL